MTASASDVLHRSPAVSAIGLADALARLPRVRLAHLPTPLERCPRLSAALGGPAIWIKRDDCTGLAFGGNKVRQHEYILGDGLHRGVDVVIQGAASQSNQSRQLAAAAAKLGLECYLLMRKDARYATVQGNQLVTRLFGARVIPVEETASLKAAKEGLAERLRAEGRTPMVLGMGAEHALTLAAVAYMAAYLEIVAQHAAADQPLPTHIYVTSQVSTQAGLQAAAALLGHDVIIRGINPMDSRNEAYEDRAAIAGKCAAAARLAGFALTVPVDRVENSTDWVGDDYGRPSMAGLEAARLLAASEGILVDPVYSGKGLSGLIGDIRSGRLTERDRVLFLHTGGLPALFAYGAEVTA